MSFSVATHRKEHDLPPLEPFVIDVISSSSANLEIEDTALLRTTKLSSTAIRQWIVDQRTSAALSAATPEVKAEEAEKAKEVAEVEK